MTTNHLESKLTLNFNSSHKTGPPRASDKCITSDSILPLRECLVNNARQQNHLSIGPISSLMSGDIEWQWSSPPAVSNMKGVVEKTPLQHMKTQCKSISPISDIFPRKRKLIRTEEIESTIIRTESLSSVANSTTNASEIRSEYSSLLDDEDAMDSCLLQCSQYVEASLSQNPQGIHTKEATTPRSTRTHTALSYRTSVSPSHGDHTIPSKANVKLGLEENISKEVHKKTMIPKEAVENKLLKVSEVSTSLHSLPFIPKTGESVVNNNSFREEHSSSMQAKGVNNTLSKVSQACSAATTYAFNDSFDDLLMTFCDENIELLSQPLKQKENRNECLLQQQYSSHETTDQTSELTVKQLCELPIKNIAKSRVSQSVTDLSTVTKNKTLFSEGTLDDDFLQPDLLKVLEKVEVEANSQPRPASPVRCTLKEIEEKRRQAKIKLERKKSATCNEINRLTYTGVLKR